MNTHSIFLDVAETISQMSHCVSHKVGAILVKDKRIISNHLFFESSFYRALRKYADAYVYPTLDDLKKAYPEVTAAANTLEET